MSSQTIAYLCVLAGASMLAGWWTAFRNRYYVGLLGGFFLALAASIAIAARLETGPKTALLREGWWAAVVVAAVLLVASFVFAVQESRRRLQEVRQHYQAASEALVAMARAKEELKRRQDQGAPAQETKDSDDTPDRG